MRGGWIHAVIQSLNYTIIQIMPGRAASRRQAHSRLSKRLKNNSTWRSPIQVLTHQLLLNFKYRLANYFPTDLPVLILENLMLLDFFCAFPFWMLLRNKSCSLFQEVNLFQITETVPHLRFMLQLLKYELNILATTLTAILKLQTEFNSSICKKT